MSVGEAIRIARKKSLYTQDNYAQRLYVVLSTIIN